MSPDHSPWLDQPGERWMPATDCGKCVIWICPTAPLPQGRTRWRKNTVGSQPAGAPVCGPSGRAKGRAIELPLSQQLPGQACTASCVCHASGWPGRAPVLHTCRSLILESGLIRAGLTAMDDGVQPVASDSQGVPPRRDLCWWRRRRNKLTTGAEFPRCAHRTAVLVSVGDCAFERQLAGACATLCWVAPSRLAPAVTWSWSDRQCVMPHAPGDRAGTTAAGLPLPRGGARGFLFAGLPPSARALFAPFLSRCCGARRRVMRGGDDFPLRADPMELTPTPRPVQGARS